jgi:hypothetical protein
MAPCVEIPIIVYAYANPPGVELLPNHLGAVPAKVQLCVILSFTNCATVRDAAEARGLTLQASLPGVACQPLIPTFPLASVFIRHASVVAPAGSGNP